MASKLETKGTRKRRSLADRAAEAALTARRLNALANAGDNDNVRHLMSAVRHFQALKPFGKAPVDQLIQATAGNLNKILQALGL